MIPTEPQTAATSGVVAPGTRIDEALARLDRSRARLKVALTPKPPPAAGPTPRSFGPMRRARGWLRAQPWGTLLDPIVGAANQAVMDWWKRQPVVRSALLAKSTLSAELSPLVRRYPIPAVLLTAMLGAVAVRSGVWRWRAVRRSSLMLASQLRRVLVGQLGSPAMQSLLLGAVVSYVAARKKPAEPVPDSASGRDFEPAGTFRPEGQPVAEPDLAGGVPVHANWSPVASTQPIAG